MWGVAGAIGESVDGGTGEAVQAMGEALLPGTIAEGRPALERSRCAGTQAFNRNFGHGDGEE